MTRMMIRFFFSIVVILVAHMSYAQENDPKWNVDGEIESAEFVIVKDKKLELPRANRFFVPITVKKNDLSLSGVQYKLKEFSFTPVVTLPTIRVKKIPNQTIEKLWGNKVTLGYGNFQSPFIDLSLANKRDKLYSYGVNFKHHSFGQGAVDEENSASGITDIEAFGKIFGKKATSFLNVGYQNEFNHFFGYQPTTEVPSADSIRQTFNRFNIKAGIFGTDLENLLRYRVETGFSSFTNDFNTTENSFNLKGNFAYKLQDDEKLKLEISGLLTQYSDSTEINRNLLRLTPSYVRKISGVYLTVGFELAIDNDTLASSTNSSVFPQLNVRFPISETFDVYGGLTGGRQFNSINMLTGENPWISQNQPLINSSNKLEVYGGLNGKIGDRISTNLGFSASGVDNMTFFVNGLNDSTRFDILYDNTSVFKFFANLEYSFFEKASVHAGATFFGYDTDVLPEAWHKPTFTFELGSKFNLYEKVLIAPTFNILSGIEALNLQSGNTATLDPIIQLNLQAKYILSERAGIYLNFNNIIGENYQRYLNYPGRGLQVNAGFSYSF